MNPPDSTPSALASAGGKAFLYLVQGKGSLPAHYAGLVSPRSDVIQLTWGEPIEGAIYLPKSTWTEGRNRLLQEALARTDKPLYYIFLDDDIVFENGDWRLFEDELLKHRPAIAAPYIPVYENGYAPLPDIDAQTCFWYDAMYTAFHRDVVEDGLLVPYYTGLDKVNWVYSQWFVIHLSHLLYPRHVVQFNRVQILNVAHEADYGEYIDLDISIGLLFTGALRRRYALKRASSWIKRRLGLVDFAPQRAPAPLPSYHVPERIKRRWLRLDSLFWSERRPILSPVGYSGSHSVS